MQYLSICASLCMYVSIYQPNPPLTHLVVEPGLLVPAVFADHALILAADLVQRLVEVLLGRGVHLHVHRVADLGAEGVDLLRGEGGGGWRSRQ